MDNINILIDSQRRASAPHGAYTIADNNDHVITFDIDDDAGFTRGTKTAVFVTDGRGKLPSVDFVGATVTLPRLLPEDGLTLYVGITQGEIKTTTPAIIRIDRSVYGYADGRVAPDPYDPPNYDELPAAESVSMEDEVIITDVSAGKRKRATLQLLSDLIDGDEATYTVTVTGSGVSYEITDRTMAQIAAAYAAEKVLQAVFPVTIGGNALTVCAPLVPMIVSGTPIGYMSQSTIVMGGHTYSALFIQASDNQADINVDSLTSDADPQPLGTKSAGSSPELSRADHVHPTPSASDIGAAPAITEVTVQTSGAVTQECADNTIYTFTGTLTSLTLTEATGAREYLVIFAAGSTAPTVTFPSGVVFPDTLTIEANKRYEVSVRDGYAVAQSWAVSA